MVQNGHAGAAKRYFDDGLAREDYYTPKVEKDAKRDEPGRWGGKGSELLGLKGAVERETFHRLCENRMPDDSGALTPRTKANRRVGYDINFHCPKSVSILYALTGDQAILDSFRAAVHETMEHLEGDAKARVRARGGEGDRSTGNLVWAEFIHTTARPINGISDPHLHAHCFTFNATFDPVERRWKAGEFGEVKRHATFYEAAFHARLAGRLGEQGYRVERRGRFWEVADVPESAIAKFSRRTAEIDRVAFERGITDPTEKASLGARTRKSKGETLPWTDLQRDWKQRLTQDEAARVHAAKNGRVVPSDRVATREALTHAFTTCFERSSVASERALLEQALRYGVGHVTLEGLEGELSQAGLLRRDVKGEPHLTTTALLEREQRILAFAREGRGACPPFNRGAGNSDAAGRTEPPTTAQNVLASRDRVTLIRGGGHSSVATIASLEALGYPVTVLRTLTESLPSASSAHPSRGELVAKFLSDSALQEHARKGIIWVHNAGSLGASSMSSLFEAATGLGARIVLSAGRARPGAGQRSDLLRQLETQAGLRSAEIQRGRRDRAEHRSALDGLDKKSTADSFLKLDRLGAIREVKASDMPAAIATEYARAAKAKKSAQVLSSHKTEQITDAIRAQLRGLRLLGRSRSFERLRALGLSAEERQDAKVYAPGQVVVFYKSAKGFKAGHRYEVMGHDPFGNVLARHQTYPRTLLPSKAPWVEALPLGKSDRFELFARSTIELAKGDALRITRTGRTTNETFGPEKLLSKRGRAIRLENFKMFGIQAPDRRYRVQKDALHRVSGFTLFGDIKLENGWILPKHFGHLDYGYCVGSPTTRGCSVERLLIAQPEKLASSPLSGMKRHSLQSVSIFTDDKAALCAAMQKDPPRSARQVEHSEAPRRSPQPHKEREHER